MTNTGHVKSQQQKTQEALRVVTIVMIFSNLRFVLKASVFSEVDLEPSRTSMMKLFAKITESH